MKEEQEHDVPIIDMIAVVNTLAKLSESLRMQAEAIHELKIQGAEIFHLTTLLKNVSGIQAPLAGLIGKEDVAQKLKKPY